MIDESSNEISQNSPHKSPVKSDVTLAVFQKLSISKIEKERIKEFVQQNLSVYKICKDIEKDNPHKSMRCLMLDEKGKCSIYEVRPVICRTHRYPILYSDKDQWLRMYAL